MRYDGRDMSVAIEEFAPPDQQLIRQLYDVLTDLLALLKQKWDTPQAGLESIKNFMQQVGWTRLNHAAQELGYATYEQEHTALLSKVVHDIKGGGFTALSIYLQLIEVGFEEDADLGRLFFLTRDHLKIIRNAVRHIDPRVQEQDEQQQYHHVDLLIEKWYHAVHQTREVAVEIVLDCHYRGNISERCLEFSALDRVLYNLINNAARFAADGKVYFSILPIPEQQPQNLRFVIYNQITPEHQKTLQARYPDHLSDIFRGGFTTGGSGLGLRICADFVNNAYGIHALDEGIKGGYFGAQRIDAYFVNWVHWPIVPD
jgi:signal transduction histidine kinase